MKFFARIMVNVIGMRFLLISLSVYRWLTVSEVNREIQTTTIYFYKNYKIICIVIDS